MPFQTLVNQLDLSRPELKAVKSAIDQGQMDLAQAALADHFRSRQSPAVPGDLRAREAHRISDSRKEEADAALDNRFIGQPKYGLRQVPEPIDWNFNPGEDPEWTWQFNRHSAWGALAEAYLATKDERYAEKWVVLMRDWVAKNPPGTPKSWRTLEAGIRAGRTWTRVFFAFLESPNFTPADISVMLGSFADHAVFLSPAEHFRSGSNWGQTESLGLLYVGTFFPEFKEATRWRDTGWQRLEAEMFIQVLEDGAQVELTTSYHQGAIHGFVHASQIAQLGGAEISAAYRERLEKMYEYTMVLQKPDGTQPMLGDSWPGDTRSILREGAERYDRPDMRYVGSGGQEGSPPEMLDAALHSAGYYVMRTNWVDPQAIYLLTDISHRWGGGHQHPDALQINLYAYGKTLLPDSGSYLYYGPDRKRFGHTRSHSTVTVDGADQDHSAAELTCFSNTPMLSFVDGSHTGYAGVTHRRQVLFARPVGGITPYFVVVDRVTGSGDHEVDQYFHFLPGPMTQAGLEARTALPEGPNLLVRTWGSDGMVMESVPSEVSFIYTQKEPRPAIRYRQKGTLPLTFVTLLMPYPGKEPPTLTCEPYALQNARALRVSGEGFSDIIFANEVPAAIPDLGIDRPVRAGVVRRNATHELARSLIE
ncbi:MAG: alginate lyase family protein [bacterium]|nr:alginate lyase family protein [bacterium]